jgi:hypothetical protein
MQYHDYSFPADTPVFPVFLPADLYPNLFPVFLPADLYPNLFPVFLPADLYPNLFSLPSSLTILTRSYFTLKFAGANR